MVAAAEVAVVAEAAAVVEVEVEVEAAVAEAAAGVSVIVTTACASTIVPLLSFERFRKNVSSGSPTPSALIVTSTYFRRSWGANVSVPDGGDVVVPLVRGSVRGRVVDRDRVVHLAAQAHGDVDDVVDRALDHRVVGRDLGPQAELNEVDAIGSR